ncbi:hypothetical protein BGX38DRAFT_1183177 [Terfezia claveryi]|nr:hypothetical protein BGX38DRAFT_1183177 [Terfezia claveryi]
MILNYAFSLVHSFSYPPIITIFAVNLALNKATDSPSIPFCSYPQFFTIFLLFLPTLMPKTTALDFLSCPHS